MDASRARVSVCVMIGLLATTANAANLATVVVADANNDPDARYATPGYGSVDYTYNIGKYEVTAGQYTEFLNAVAGVDANGLYNPNMANTAHGSGITRTGAGIAGDKYQYSVADAFVDRPVNYVSYWDACRFANWLQNSQPTGEQVAGTTETGAYTLTADGMANNTVTRNADWEWAVTSENEWYKAAYYKGGSTSAGYWDYPTRSNTAPGQDMDDVSHNNANIFTDSSDYPIDGVNYTTIGGEFQDSPSPYGTFDQGGNVREWNEALVFALARGARGGSFAEDDSGDLIASGRLGFGPSSEYYTMGFRVVYQTPEPATMGLFVLGGLAMIRRRR